MSALIAAYVAPESDKEASSTSLSAYSTGRRSAKRSGLRRKHSARLGESIAHRSGSFPPLRTPQDPQGDAVPNKSRDSRCEVTARLGANLIPTFGTFPFPTHSPST